MSGSIIVVVIDGKIVIVGAIAFCSTFGSSGHTKSTTWREGSAVTHSM